MMTNHQVAALLDSVSDYIEKLAGEKYREHAETTAHKIAQIDEQLRVHTGSGLTPEAYEKLASCDAVVLDLLVKQAQAVSGVPSSMGGPAEIDTYKIAAANPEDALLAFCQS